MLTNVLNPKPALFYLTVLPQFVSPADPVLTKSLLLASCHIALKLVWLSIFAFFVASAGHTFRRSGIGTWLERAAAVFLIWLGLRLAWERN